MIVNKARVPLLQALLLRVEVSFGGLLVGHLEVLLILLYGAMSPILYAVVIVARSLALSRIAFSAVSEERRAMSDA